MVDIRATAKQILANGVLAKLKEHGGLIASDGSSAGDKGDYETLTGISQKTLEDNWASGGSMTGCNGLTGIYANTLARRLPGTKAPGYLGIFPLATELPKRHMGHAWIESTPDARPKYGDIYRSKVRYHVGISLQFEGNVWHHVDAGQRRPGENRDTIKEVREPYNFMTVEGWVDIELYFGTSPQEGAVPAWLLDWWQVDWPSRSYFYSFKADRTVECTTMRPGTIKLSPIESGIYAVDPSAVTIRWKNGTLEVFHKWSADMLLRGWSRGEVAMPIPLTARRLFG